MIPPSHIAGLSCNQNKKPNIWRIMCRRWLISDKEVGSELINKLLSPSYCYCKNVLVFFWQININFLQHMKVILIIIQFFWHSKGRVNWTSDLNMVKITGTSSIYFDPRKFWPVNDNQIYVLVKLYSTEGWSVEQVLASAPQNPLAVQFWQALVSTCSAEQASGISLWYLNLTIELKSESMSLHDKTHLPFVSV